MKLSIISILLPLSFISCQVCGLTSGYSHLSKFQKSKVIECKGSIGEISDYSNVYTVKVEQVEEYISKHNDVIVYDYTPYCKSAFCVSPMSLQETCKMHGINLLIISNIYDDLFHATNAGFPLLMIDVKSCNTKIRSKYIDVFYRRITGHLPKELGYASYHRFHNGQYVRSYNDYKQIEYKL